MKIIKKNNINDENPLKLRAEVIKIKCVVTENYCQVKNYLMVWLSRSEVIISEKLDDKEVILASDFLLESQVVIDHDTDKVTIRQLKKFNNCGLNNGWRTEQKNLNRNTKVSL